MAPVLLGVNSPPRYFDERDSAGWHVPPDGHLATHRRARDNLIVPLRIPGTHY